MAQECPPRECRCRRYGQVPSLAVGQGTLVSILCSGESAELLSVSCKMLNRSDGAPLTSIVSGGLQVLNHGINCLFMVQTSAVLSEIWNNENRAMC